MKRSLQLVALLLLVSVVALAGRDRLAEKREAARERAYRISPVPLKVSSGDVGHAGSEPHEPSVR